MTVSTRPPQTPGPAMSARDLDQGASGRSNGSLGTGILNLLAGKRKQRAGQGPTLASVTGRLDPDERRVPAFGRGVVTWATRVVFVGVLTSN